MYFSTGAQFCLSARKQFVSAHQGGGAEIGRTCYYDLTRPLRNTSIGLGHKEQLDHFYLSFFLGGPMGGICWLARALNASAIRWGWEATICFQPPVSITSVTCRVLINSMA